MSGDAVTLPWALLGLELGLDRTTGPLLGLTLFLWSLAAVHAAGSLAADPRRRQFMGFFALTFAGNVGLLLARDGPGFYLFFAVMTFAAYGLVVHTREPDAVRAGRVYIALAVLGEGALLAGLFLAAADAASFSIADLRKGAATSPDRDLIVALLFAGFGVKAGAIGVHMWLPLAHPVAPTPASAVLSGAMIKAGLLGWLHFLPVGEVSLPAWGFTIAAAGVAAALYGAVVGVMQRDAKTVLAYSSISQMGIITIAVGAAIADAQAAAGATAAAVFYAVHHGLAKGALFLGVGIDALGRRMRLAILALPALVLAGLPWTSGAFAKHALKHSLETAPWADTGAALLGVAAIGTTLLMARFLVVMARGQAHGTSSRRAAGAWVACVAASLAAAALHRVLLGATGAAGDLWSAAWPLLAGTLLAALAWRAGRGAAFARVPPGDLLVPLDRLAHRAGLALSAIEARTARWAYRAFDRLADRWTGFVRRFEPVWRHVEGRLREGAYADALIVALLLFWLAA